MDSAYQKVLAQIDADNDHVVALTQDLVRIPSVNPKFQTGEGINRESDVQDRIETELKELSCDIKRWDALPERPNLTGDIAGSEEKSLILSLIHI